MSSMRFFMFALVLLAGCPLLDVEVEIGEVCMTYRDIEIDATAAASASFTFDDLAPIHELLEYDAELRLVRAELRPTSGITDFRFIESARVTLLATETLPELAAYDCDGDCVSDGGVLAVPAAVQQDVVGYLRGDSVAVTIDLAGAPPVDRFTMDVDVCLRGHVRETVEP